MYHSVKFNLLDAPLGCTCIGPGCLQLQCEMDGLSTRSLTGLSVVWERDGRMHATMIRLVTPIRSREQVQWPVAVAGARTYQCVLPLLLSIRGASSYRQTSG